MALTVLMATALAACSHTPAPARHSATPHNVTLTREQQRSIRVATVRMSRYRTTIMTTGVVDFDHNRATDMLAPMSGAVTRVRVSLGQHVVKGQALADVASPDFAAAAGAYRRTVLAARAADAVAANDRALYAHQAISQRENASAQADAASADADRSAALQALLALHMSRATLAAIRAGRTVAGSEGVIRAPISGTVVAKSIAPGQTLAAGATPCFTIADTSRMWVMAKLFGRDIERVRAGDVARIDTGDGDPALKGTVTHLSAVVDPATRAVNARVEVDNRHGLLKQAMYVSVQIRSRQARRGLLVPVTAVLRNDENQPFVYAVMHDGSYARREVTLGMRVGHRYVVSGGLHAGERIVVDGSIFLNFMQSQ